MNTKKLAEDHVDNHGAPSLGRQLDSLLAYVEAQTVHRVAAWLDAQAEAGGVVEGAYYREAARRLRDGAL